MKTTESTGLPTMLREVAVRKMNAGFIELTMMEIPKRVLFPLAHIPLVAEPEEMSGCYVYYGDDGSYVTVRESYDEVKRLIEEASK